MLLSSWRHLIRQSKVRKTQTFSNFCSQQQAFIALNFSAAAAPVLPVQVPGAGIRAGHIRAPTPRQDHLYLLCADVTLHTVRSRKAGRQAREALALAQSQQKVSRCLKVNAISQRLKMQAEQPSKFSTRVYKFQTPFQTRILQYREVLYFL